MTPLRQKLIDAIDVRGLSPLTRRNYTDAVAKLARHYKKSPDVLTDDQIRDYLLHLIRDLKRAPATITVAVCALRFFYRAVLNRSLYAIETALPHMRKPVKRPQVYSTGEIEQLLRAPGLNGKHRMLLMTAYATGLRVAELCRLRVEDINSARMQVRVIQGKGGKDRYTTLSAKCSTNCAATGKCFVRATGSFPPGSVLTNRSQHARRNAFFSGRWNLRDFPAAEASTACGTALPPICSKWEWSCRCCSGCWATAASMPPRSISMSVRPKWPP